MRVAPERTKRMAPRSMRMEGKAAGKRWTRRRCGSGASSMCWKKSGAPSWTYSVHRSGSFIDSSDPFFGMISSMYGVSSGYVVSSVCRSPRCTDDFSFDLGAAEILQRGERLRGARSDVSHIIHS